MLDWCHDDQPVWMKTRAGRILSVPYPQELNDIPQIVARKREGAEFADMILDAFEVMAAECAKRPLVMGVALHPYVVGWPHRFKHLARALKHIARQAGDKVWFTTAGRDRRARGGAAGRHGAVIARMLPLRHGRHFAARRSRRASWRPRGPCSGSISAARPSASR